MGWIKEFKEFALKGNMIELAIGVIIGVAFGKVVNSLVTDILMPPLGVLIGGIDFSDFKIVLPKSAGPVAEIKYGLFINALISFFIVAFTIFVVIKLMKKLQPTSFQERTKECPECLMKIPYKAKRCAHCTSLLK